MLLGKPSVTDLGSRLTGKKVLAVLLLRSLQLRLTLRLCSRSCHLDCSLKTVSTER